ncbi:hypothetical protein PPECC33_p22 (plasmid) [Escherichia coli PCN033]|nr:hypothetical protein PPECC33_p22 [Escherichia coli PCN033]
MKNCVKSALMQRKKNPLFLGAEKQNYACIMCVLLAFIPVDEHRRTSTNITRC